MLAAIRTCFLNYFTFSGRARRSEFWWFVLFVVAVAWVLSFVDQALFGVTARENGPLEGTFELAVFIPLLAAGWRRLHDSGRTGWLAPVAAVLGLVLAYLVLLVFVDVFQDDVRAAVEAMRASGDGPTWVAFSEVGVSGVILEVVLTLVMFIPSIYWMTRPTDPQDNRYGPVPPA